MNDLLIGVFLFWLCAFLIALSFKSIEIHNAKMALKHIKGYCVKHWDCSGCMFKKDDCCPFRDDLPPCDWEEVE